MNAVTDVPKLRCIMSDRLEDLVLLLLRRLDQRLGEVKADMVEVKERLGIIETQYSSMSRRLDRMGGDIEMIKRRLDLVES